MIDFLSYNFPFTISFSSKENVFLYLHFQLQDKNLAKSKCLPNTCELKEEKKINVFGILNLNEYKGLNNIKRPR